MSSMPTTSSGAPPQTGTARPRSTEFNQPEWERRFRETYAALTDEQREAVDTMSRLVNEPMGVLVGSISQMRDEISDLNERIIERLADTKTLTADTKTLTAEVSAVEKGTEALARRVDAIEQ